MNSCISSNLPSFNTRLDLGATAGNSTLTNVYYHNVVWTTTNALPGMDISVSDQGTDSNEGLVRAYDMAYFLSGGEWTHGSYYPYGYFPGHFDSQPVTPPNAVPPGDPGDILLGLKLNSASANRAMLLSFGAEGFDDLGFRISSILANDFTLRVQVFANSTGTGTPLYDTLTDTTFSGSYLGAGGTCASLTPDRAHGQPNPIPCNNAPFFGLVGFDGTAHSILISTNDPGGFYISQIYLGNDTPEPGTIVLSCCGLAAIVIARRRSRRNA